MPGRPEGEVDLAVSTGKVEVAVVRHAEQHEVDVIVVGATGRTGLTRLLLGSTAERIVQHAPCPVLTVKVGGRGFITA